jgi:hypothetical protein
MTTMHRAMRVLDPLRLGPPQWLSKVFDVLYDLMPVLLLLLVGVVALDVAVVWTLLAR